MSITRQPGLAGGTSAAAGGGGAGAGGAGTGGGSYKEGDSMSIPSSDFTRRVRRGTYRFPGGRVQLSLQYCVRLYDCMLADEELTSRVRIRLVGGLRKSTRVLKHGTRRGGEGGRMLTSRAMLALHRHELGDLELKSPTLVTKLAHFLEQYSHF